VFWDFIYFVVDMPLNSLKDPKVDPRTKQGKIKKVEAHSLIHNISGVGRHARTLRWD